MSTQAKNLLTPEEYLAIEREAEFRHEYYCGEMFAMAGATEPHVVIADNIGFRFRLQTADRRCRIYRSDMKVATPDTKLFTYPDVIVMCGQPQFHDKQRDVLVNPTAIAEVLSRSTESYDRGLKFENYRKLASLRQYLLVAQDRMHVDLYTLTEAGWHLESADGPDASIDFAGCRLKLSDVYENVDLTPEP